MNLQWTLWNLKFKILIESIELFGKVEEIARVNIFLSEGQGCATILMLNINFESRMDVPGAIYSNISEIKSPILFSALERVHCPTNNSVKILLVGSGLIY